MRTTVVEMRTDIRWSGKMQLAKVLERHWLTRWWLVDDQNKATRS